MLPNIPPKLFSISAVAIGYLLIDDSTANEQNALGNWLMLVAQVLSTNAFYRVLMQERGLEPKESTEYEKNSSYSFTNNSNPFANNFNSSQTECNETIIMLEKMIRALEKEIGEIKKKMNK
ncbi:MAG: hypothetical protein PUB18_04950 [bacterium]|nr:hypothetical protein [bacterium]